MIITDDVSFIVLLLKLSLTVVFMAAALRCCCSLTEKLRATESIVASRLSMKEHDFVFDSSLEPAAPLDLPFTGELLDPFELASELSFESTSSSDEMLSAFRKSSSLELV